jgi:hypothetical protein
MGIAAGDFDTDSRLDLFKTHFGDTNALYRGNGKAIFATSPSAPALS